MKISKLLANDLVITLSATLIGVFVALYLNEWIADKKLSDQKKIAIDNVITELSSNQIKLEKALERHIQMYDLLIFLRKYSENGENLIAPQDSMRAFMTKHPELVILSDSTKLDNGYYHYKGEMNSNLSVAHLELTTVAWETIKSSGLSTSFGFDCLMYLESLDKLTSEIILRDRVLLEYMTNNSDDAEQNEKIIKHLHFLIGYEKSIGIMYEKSEEKLSECS